MDKLRALQAFIAIVDRGSLTAAADTLGLSLPAVVRTLAALESSLNARLLNRTTRRLSLTDEGRQYLERARRIVADLDEADRALGAQRTEPAGALRVTAPVLFGQYHVAPAIARFLAEHPRMRIELVLLDRVVNLVEEGLDVAVRIGPLDDSTLIAQPVGRIRHLVVAGPVLLRRQGVPRHPRELAGAQCLRSEGGDGAHWAFRDGARRIAVKVQGPLQCNLAEPLLHACAAGLGFARCLSYQAMTLLDAGRLRVVLADYEVEPWPLSVVWPSSRLLPSRTRAFIDAMKAELSRVPVAPAAVKRPKAPRRARGA